MIKITKLHTVAFARNFSVFFSDIIMNTLKEQTVSLHELEKKLLMNFQKAYPDNPEKASWMARNVYHRLMDDKVDLNDVSLIFEAIGLKWGVMVNPIEEEEALKYPAIWDQEIDELDLPVRATNCLKFAAEPAVLYIGQLVAMHPNALLKIVNIGHTTAKRIEVAMAQRGLKFGTDTGDWKPPVK